MSINLFINNKIIIMFELDIGRITFNIYKKNLGQGKFMRATLKDKTLLYINSL